MSFKIDGIKDDDDLRKAQAAVQAEGSSITNYNEWADVLQTLNEAGVESTGTYAGDKAKMKEIEETVEKFIQEQQIEQISKQKEGQTQQVKQNSESDSDQEIKATVANGTSSMIIADYMKYYHLMT